MEIYGKQEPHVFSGRDGRPSLPYLLYLPQNYDSQQGERWPLVLFLHGAGERGDGGETLKTLTSNGLPKLVKEGQEFPFLIVSPQCPANDWWSEETLVQQLGALLDEIERTYKVDPTRIYVTGLSMGGFGTWALGIAQPQRFAALAPICGGGDPSKVCALKNVPVWNFHGARDSIVALSYSEEMIAALEECGGHVTSTVYADADHDSWTRTYENPELYKWLLSQRNEAAARDGGH